MPRIHGHTGRNRKATRTYTSWAEMQSRCRNPKAPLFERYGGRGIVVCDRWKRFENFLTDLGERPSGMTLDRIDNDGHYEPGNVRWATRAMQSRNTSRNRWIEANGERLCVRDWAARLGVAPHTLKGRLDRGWDPVRAVTEPAHEASRRLAEWRSPS